MGKGTPMGKADYSKIAEVYDEVRRSDLPHIVWWITKIALEGKLAPGRRLIDLGCGTGRWTIPLAERTGCEAVGLDRSPEMLAKARAKDSDGRVTWVQGDCEKLVGQELELLPNRPGTHAQAGAEAPALRSESFDCALMSLMMHHLEDHLNTFRGVFRILRPGGVFLIRQGTLEDILRDAMHRFFPDAVTIDRKRTPFRSEIEWWLGEAGFNTVHVETFKQHTYSSNMRLLEEIEKRVASAMRMIDDDAFKAGLERFKAYLRRPADDPSIRDSLFTLFTARKAG
jgi:ubiquinone/menaquinone biosynthesis C-methylase UbiE